MPAFVLIAKERICSELSLLPWRPLESNWCAFMQPTSIIRSTQVARHFLRSVCILMLLFQAWISTRTNTSYLLIIFLRCVLTCIKSKSFDTSHYVGIEICRRYSRSTYRYIPKISNDISRSLDTIPNTTSKLVRTHTWGYASLPQLFTVQRMLLLYLYTLGFLNPQHPEPAEST